MSGPKIIRIVTREEILSICQGHLTRLDAVIDEWSRIGKRNNTVSDEDVASMMVRRDALRQLLAEDRFAELQKQVPAEISFLRADAQDRLRKAAAAALAVRQSQRRVVQAGQTMLNALTRAEKNIPEDLRRILESSKTDVATMEAAIARAFTLLSEDEREQGRGKRLREIAAKYGSDGRQTSLADWMARQPPEKGWESELQIDEQLAELALHDAEAASAFEARESEIAREESTRRRALMVDSLLFELGAAVRRCRDRTAVLSKLTEVHAEIATIETSSAQKLSAEIEIALSSQDVGVAAGLLESATALIVSERRAMAAAARRRVVLQGLASLGYEVTEGMATAWVQNGRIALRKAADPSYGVELGGGTQNDRMQVRTVGFGNPSDARDTNRDRDMEAIWCSEFDRLRLLLAKAGGESSIEQSLPVGAVPIKVIEADTAPAASSAEIHGLRTHQRDR